ncbi:hypothetical protein OFY17_10445 [Marinomonas sp. C2222]|uniref:Lipoprotein n=1 Tax=Marinomonas sargassi TaxID=2984494 RepID=A0ABT2YTS4_9GAMM|nr:hypothetical protein [Marinomonas sargassi]MCV2403299.1 hypothetical protein [Marinomonas sargassi]
MNKKLFSLLFSALFLTACQQNLAPVKDQEPLLEGDHAPTQQVEEPKTIEAAADGKLEAKEKNKEKTISAFEKITLGLIERGEQALAARRLLTPEEDNANLYFQAALGRDPGNFEATQGIANIVELYGEWAWQAAQGRNYRQASRYLESARSVNSQDPLINEIDLRIQDLQQKRLDEARHAAQQQKKKTLAANDDQEQSKQQENVYFLPKELFSLSDDEVLELLQPIIDKVNEQRAPIAISWAKDKEARLLYQIINSRTPEFRLRAMIFHRTDYKIELQQD